MIPEYSKCKVLAAMQVATWAVIGCVGCLAGNSLPDDKEVTVEQLLRAQGIKVMPQAGKMDFGPRPLRGHIHTSRELRPINVKISDGAIVAEDTLSAVKALAKKDEEWYWIPK